MERSSICWFILHMIIVARAGLGWSQEARASWQASLLGIEAQVFGPSSTTSVGALIGSCIGIGAARIQTRPTRVMGSSITCCATVPPPGTFIEERINSHRLCLGGYRWWNWRMKLGMIRADPRWRGPVWLTCAFWGMSDNGTCYFRVNVCKKHLESWAEILILVLKWRMMMSVF